VQPNILPTDSRTPRAGRFLAGEDQPAANLAGPDSAVCHGIFDAFGTASEWPANVIFSVGHSAILRNDHCGFS